MKQLTLLSMLLALFVFSACTPYSELSYNKSTLNLRVENKTLQVQGTELKSNNENYTILYLEQKLLRLDDGSMVMYEHGDTDIEYEFAQITSRTVDIVFDTRKMVKVYDHALVYAYQLILADSRVLNVVVSQSFDQEFTMVYGMSSNKLDKMLKKLNPLSKPVPYRHAITLEHEPNPLLSRWTTWKINFVPLIQPLPRFIRI